MTAPVQVVIAVLGLITAARTRLTGVVLGQPVSVPILLLAATVLILVLVLAVLWLLRSIAQEGGLRLRPRMVST